MDIYYHLLTAWGFIQAGGYSGWDFWQYAPFGRLHIYPPLLHLILALFIKMGMSKVLLAKMFETLMPVVFLFVVRYIIRKYYSDRLAFFTMVTLSSSFSFYMSLINHLPATLAIIFGLFAFEQLFQRRLLRAVVLLTLCFYTHIGISLFSALSFIFYALLNPEYRRFCLNTLVSVIILSSPIICKELIGLKLVSRLGFNLVEKRFCQFKVSEYLLAFMGLWIVFKLRGRYWLFLSLFLASFIFLAYPYRFFSQEGYLPIIFLSAVSLDYLSTKLSHKKISKYIVFLLVLFLLFISPTILLENPFSRSQARGSVIFAQTAITGMIFPTDESRGFSNTIWYPDEYLSTANFIKENSQNNDIIYSSINLLGVCFASLSERATANALLPEIDTKINFDPLSVSKIIVVAKDENPQQLNQVINKYNLVKIGENKLFFLYKNDACNSKIDIRKASLPFWCIGIMVLALIISLIIHLT